MKEKQVILTAIKSAIQLFFFFCMPTLFAQGFAGMRYILEQIHRHEVIAMTPFVKTLIILFVVTVLFGRYFCGWVCAFGSIGDWLYLGSSAIQKKLRKKVFRLPDSIIHKLQYAKYIVLIGILGACLTGTYSEVSSADPWGVFGSAISGNFFFEGRVIAYILLALILIGMCFVERFFCQFICPLGACFSLSPILPFVTLNSEKEKCIKGCTLCVKGCPAAISLGEPNSKHGECFGCAKCYVKCPKKNIKFLP